MVIKETRLKPKRGKGIDFYCRSLIRSIEVSNCGNDSSGIMCSYGIITTNVEIDRMDKEMRNILTKNNLLFMSNAVVENTVYLLYEFIDGKTLREIIDIHLPIDNVDFEKYVRQILEVLVLLQDHDLVHLDIKPENIMIDNEKKNVKFIDTEFLCKKTNPTCKMMGMSVSYTSPEAYASMFSTKYFVDDTAKSYLMKSDVFATGLIFYEMLTGRKGMNSIYQFGKKIDEGGELELVFDDDEAARWQYLIEKMVLRDYKKRLNAKQSLQMVISIIRAHRSVFNGENVSSAPIPPHTFILPHDIANAPPPSVFDGGRYHEKRRRTWNKENMYESCRSTVRRRGYKKHTPGMLRHIKDKKTDNRGQSKKKRISRRPRREY